MKEIETTFLEDDRPTSVVSNILQIREKTNSLCELENYIKNSKAKFSKIYLNCNYTHAPICDGLGFMASWIQK